MHEVDVHHSQHIMHIQAEAVADLLLQYRCEQEQPPTQYGSQDSADEEHSISGQPH